MHPDRTNVGRARAGRERCGDRETAVAHDAVLRHAPVGGGPHQIALGPTPTTAGGRCGPGADRQRQRGVADRAARFHVREATRIDDLVDPGGRIVGNLAFAAHLLRGDRIRPRMRVHHRFTGLFGEVEQLRIGGVANGGRARLADHVVVGRHPDQGMAALVPAVECRNLVSRSLKFLGDHFAAGVDRDAVDELDVGRPSPRGHQAVGLRAAILVGKNHRVAKLTSLPGRDDLVPHQQRQVGELADGVRPRVDDRCHRFRRIAVGVDQADAQDLDRCWSCIRCAEFPIALDRQLVSPGRQRSQTDAVVGRRFPAEQEQVLRIRAVD